MGRPRILYPRRSVRGMADSDPADSDTGDDTKRKFREALERKKAQGAGGASHADGASRQSHAHGPAEQRRTFRRKSGG